MKKATEGKRVTNDVTVQLFNHTSTSISGTAESLRKSLQELEADLKKDEEGRKVGGALPRRKPEGGVRKPGCCFKYVWEKSHCCRTETIRRGGPTSPGAGI